jgi:glycosyltransferase involved in cell wall biosynthesis
MSYISGQWLCFCDHDDYFEDNALSSVKSFIEKLNHKSYVVSTIMNGYDEEKHEYGLEFAHKLAWLHGKFYSVDNLIRPYDINFKKDLKTHEDIYFNSSALSVLFELRTDWDYLDISTYRWIDDKTSITRQKRDDRGYLYENFNDYIVAASEPFWDRCLKTREWIYANQLMMTLLHAYFYYEARSYYVGPYGYEDIVNSIRTYIHKMIDEFKITANDIIDFVYADPVKYEGVLQDCCIYVGKFIPKTSFRDFVFKLSE